MQSILYSDLITFPFEQLGMGLRKLSLSGSAGNTAAIIAYILICLVPCMIFLGLKKAHKILKADFFLPLLSILLFAVIRTHVLRNRFLFCILGIYLSSRTGKIQRRRRRTFTERIEIASDSHEPSAHLHLCRAMLRGCLFRYPPIGGSQQFSRCPADSFLCVFSLSVHHSCPSLLL